MSQNIQFRTPGIWEHRTYDLNGSLVQNLDKPASSAFVLRTSSGYTGPKSREKPPPLHSYSLNVQRITLKHDASYKYVNGTVRSEEAHGPGLSTTIAGATLYPSYDWSSLEAKALAKLTDEVRGDLDLSVDLAEAGKTIKMLRLTDHVVNTLRTIKSRRLGALKAAGALWLMNTYGLQPTLQSIFGLADENLRTVINKTERYKVRASEWFYPDKCNVLAVVGSVDFPVPKGSRLKTSITYGMDLRTDQFDITRFSSLNPASIAWELMPLSFVYDWFFNVGGYLRQMETCLLYANRFRSGYKTKLVVGSLPFTLLQTQGGIEPYTSHWQGLLKMVDINRSVLASYPAPRLPSFKAQLGSSRMLSAAALMSMLLNTESSPLPKISRRRQRRVQENSRALNSKPGDKRGVHSPSDWGI